MKPKGTYKVFCPASLGATGGQWKHASSEEYSGDVTYEFEVIESNRQPEALDPGFHIEEMHGGQCFYIAHKGRNDNEYYALEVSEKDAYYPRNTGLYNIAMYPFKGRNKKVANKAQQFVYNEEDHTIESMLHPGKAIFEGFNKNLVVYSNKRYNQQRMKWDQTGLRMLAAYTGHAFDVKSAPNMKSGDNVVTDD